MVRGLSDAGPATGPQKAEGVGAGAAPWIRPFRRLPPVVQSQARQNHLLHGRKAPPWRELPLVMETMKDAPARMRVLFLFSLCSMLRPGENAKLRKSWIEADVLTIPAVEMKKGRAHRVPITAFMQTLINAEQRLSPHPRSDFIFAVKQTGKHVSAQALAKHLHSTDLSGKLVAHGLRSIARSWLADHETPFEVAEACLSHVSGTAVSRAYQRSDYLAARTPVMTRWSAFIEKHVPSPMFYSYKTQV